MISEVGSSNSEVSSLNKSFIRRRYPPLEGAGGGLGNYFYNHNITPSGFSHPTLKFFITIISPFQGSKLLPNKIDFYFPDSKSPEG
jgi:hypothetical protein